MRILLTAYLLLCGPLLFAQKSNDSFEQKLFMLKRFMDKKHYRPLAWTESNSVRLYDLWLKELDENKILFTKKDIALLDQFRSNASVVNKNGNDLFTVSIKLYRERLKDADSSIRLFLAKPIDFVKPDMFSFPAADYAADNKELELRRRHSVKWSVLDNIFDRKLADSIIPEPTLPKDLSLLEAEERDRMLKKGTGYSTLLQQNPVDLTEDMQDRFLDAVARSYDPHSNYMNLSVKQEFEAEVSAEEYSAGFTLEENEKGEKLIDYLAPGSSAWKSGQVHKGDELIRVKVGKKEYNVADLENEYLSDILGKSGSIEITLKTAAGEIKTVKLAQEKEADEESIVKSYLLKGKKTIGYIDLPGFYSRETNAKKINYEGCAKDLSRELIKLKKDNIEGLIIDLRNNGGGSMWEAIQLAGIFIDAGPVASVKDREGRLIFMKDPNRGTMYDGPMVILVNGRSASASEFFAATMQDYNRAIIVGGTTFGKGSAQEILPMDTIADPSLKDYKDFVKVTDEKFYRVNGSTVQWKGVEPDIELPDIYSASSINERSMPCALVPDSAKAGYFQPLPALPIAALKEKSRARVAGEPYFNMINKFIDAYSQMKKGMQIPLDWAGFVNFHQKLYPSLSPADRSIDAENALLETDNNSFDKGRISFNDEYTKEANAAYLKRLARSNEIAEAEKILEDRINIK